MYTVWNGSNRIKYHFTDEGELKLKYFVENKIRFVKPICINGEYGEVDPNLIFTITYVAKGKYWIGNMCFDKDMLEEITEPVAEQNFTGTIIEWIKEGKKI